MWSERLPQETTTQHQDRLVTYAATWLNIHLQQMIPIVILVSNAEMASQSMKMLPIGVVAQTLDDYMTGMWSQGTIIRL